MIFDFSLLFGIKSKITTESRSRPRPDQPAAEMRI